MLRMKRLASLLLGLGLIVAGLPALAQEAGRRGAAPESRGAEQANAGFRLPASVVTHHVLELPGRTLRFTATVGAIRQYDLSGNPYAEIFYVAYQLENPPARRPVSFALNGGPGFASAWLHLGVLGPWRLPMTGDGARPSADPVALPNAETWLDFTDLVFLDPVGTGFSRLVSGSDDARKRVWGVDGDIDSLAAAMRTWLETSGRVAAPKYIIGESYGGFRAPRIARALVTERGIGVDGLVLISPALDFGGSTVFDPLDYVGRLPSYAAVAMARKGGVDRAALDEAERYAEGDFLRDLTRGVRDTAATGRVVARVGALTGLDPAVVARMQGRIGLRAYTRELFRAEGLVASPYDPTLTLPDPAPGGGGFRADDPVLDALSAPMTSGMLVLLDRLDWHPQAGARYRLFNRDISSQWDWGSGRNPLESITALGQAVALDPSLRVLVAHGMFDIVTPYFATTLRLRDIPAAAGAERVKLTTYRGGHMFYANDDSRVAFRADAAAMYQRP